MNKEILKRSIILISLASSAAVFAKIYQWVDEKGITHIRDNPRLGKKETTDKSENKKVDEDEGTALKEADAAFTSSDYTNALALLKPLAERGNPRAQNGLGFIYSRGLGVPKDLNEALKGGLAGIQTGAILPRTHVC